MNVEIDLCGMFVNFYNSCKSKGFTFIPDTIVARKIMIDTYKNFLKEKILTPIEDLEVEEKMKLVNECREMKDTFYTNEKLIESSKILSVIKIINNQT